MPGEAIGLITISRQFGAWLLILLSLLSVAPAVLLLRKPRGMGAGMSADAH